MVECIQGPDVNPLTTGVKSHLWRQVLACSHSYARPTHSYTHLMPYATHHLIHMTSLLRPFPHPIDGAYHIWRAAGSCGVATNQNVAKRYVVV